MEQKTIVIFVTRTGNSRALAKRVSDINNAPLAEIGDLVDRSGKLAYLRAGASSIKGKKSPIQDPNVELTLFSNVILVQPMWAFSLCPPMRTWVEAHKTELTNKNIGLIVSHLGTNPEKIRTNFEKDYGALKSFCSIRENTPEQVKQAEIEKFIAEFMG